MDFLFAQRPHSYWSIIGCYSEYNNTYTYVDKGEKISKSLSFDQDCDLMFQFWWI